MIFYSDGLKMCGNSFPALKTHVDFSSFSHLRQTNSTRMLDATHHHGNPIRSLIAPVEKLRWLSGKVFRSEGFPCIYRSIRRRAFFPEASAKSKQYSTHLCEEQRLILICLVKRSAHSQLVMEMDTDSLYLYNLRRVVCSSSLRNDTNRDF